MTRTRNRLPVGLTVLAILAVAAAFLLDGWANFHLHGGQQ